MNPLNSDDIYTVTWSQKKVWGYAIFCWVFAAFLLIPAGLLIWGVVSGQARWGNLDLAVTIIAAFALLLAALPFLFLKRRHRPLATLTRDGFSGMQYFKDKHLPWQKDTKTTYVKNIGLVNPDPDQSKLSVLFWGHKQAAVVHHPFAEDTREMVEDAIRRFNPYG